MPYKDPEYRLKNKERQKEYDKKWRAENKERQKEYDKKWYLENKKYKKEYDKNRYKKNREKLIECSKKWYLENREKVKEYYKKNKEHKNKYFKNKRRNNPNFRLGCNLRTRIWIVLKGVGKSASTMKLIGCTINELWQHLESKFQNGMTRENYGRGGWDVDHIKPCAHFDLTNPEQQRICFHWTNLQPMWHIENIKKGKRIT